MQDLHVVDRLPQMITLSESYIQVTRFCLLLTIFQRFYWYTEISIVLDPLGR